MSRGTKETSSILRAARQYREAGNFAAAEKLYRQGYNRAKQQGDQHTATLAMIAAANCQVVQFQFRTALESYLEAKRLATSTEDRLNLGAVELSLSNLYEQVNDLDSARLSAEQARAAILHIPKIYYKAQLLMQLGRLRATRSGDDAEALLEEGIEAARAQGDVPLEARGWDLLGQQRLQRGRAAQAERALDEAFRLRALLDRRERSSSYGKLGALKLAEGDLDAAARFTDRAIAAGVREAAPWPEYRLIHQRGEIRLARGDIAGALKDFGEAVDLSAQWRAEVLPTTSSLAGTNELLEKMVFNSFIETGAAEALRKHNSRWAGETFQALELNRSASLRESIGLANATRKRLTPEFWDALSELRAEEARLLRSGTRGSERADSLKLKLTEMEAETGLPFSLNHPENIENFRSRSSLIHFQDGLGASELLISVHLGESDSYLWAVTQKTLSLHRLPPEQRLRSEVREFREAIQSGSGDPERIGERLYAELFGDLKGSEIHKPIWLLSLEDTLFELPFAALVTERKDGKVTYLVERHSLQIIPGALSLARTRRTATAGAASDSRGWLLGVGDPVYNTADPRWHGADTGTTWRSAGLWPVPGLISPAVATNSIGQLNRLVGSGSEIELSARNWIADSGTVVLLRGAEARRGKFLSLLAPSSLIYPAVIHLATHVVVPPERAGMAFIAFGLNSSAQTEFLSTPEVAELHVPGALVVMTGCDTGSGEARAGTGLLGLTRAWLMAGADAVLATVWPVKDSTGEIFTSFYSNLEGASAAEALRRSQVEMIRSGTRLSEPSYWASYQVTGGVH